MKPIYLDYAAATPMDDAAVQAMQPYLAERFFNPSAVYEAARDVRRDLEQFRADVADVLGCKDQEITFTAGGTEANNIAIHGVMQQFPDGHMVVSSIEHESVLEPAKQYDHTPVPVKPSGQIDLEALDKAITDKTVLVSIMYANNEIGTVQPIKDIAALIQKKRSERTNYPLFFHTDACQAANYLPVHTPRLKVDLMTLNGGKIYASKQSGVLYKRKEVRLAPYVQGGGQESGLRSGTENMAAIASFATMLQKVQKERREESQRLQQMRDTIIATISQNIPTIIPNGDSNNRLAHNINIMLPGADGERLLMELDEAGVMVATGSACTASSDEPSHVLKAIGLTDKEAAASIRITLGRPTTEREAAEAAKRIITVFQRHQAVEQ